MKHTRRTNTHRAWKTRSTSAFAGRRSISGGAAVWLLAWIGLAMGGDLAGAQETEEDPWAGIEVMLVTGAGSVLVGQTEKTSVLSFDTEDLLEARITDVGSLAEYTPNLEIKTGASNVSSPTIFIRGIGLLDFNSNASSSVAIYNDGMYMNSPLGQLFQFFDLAGVEVLRGPQGVTNARSATAGAIRITPQKPNGEFNATSIITYGNYDRVEVEGAMGFPIIPDLLSGRIAARWTEADGYTKNRCAVTPGEGTCDRNGNPGSPTSNEGRFGPVPSGLPKWVNDTDNWAGRFMLRLEPTEDQDWVFSMSGGQSSAYAYQFQSRGTRDVQDGIGADALTYRDEDRDAFAGDYDLVDDENLNIVTSTLNGEIEFDHAILSSMTGYSRATTHAKPNFDASPNQFAHAYTDDEVWQVSQELSLADAEEGRFSWGMGGFFLTEILDSSTDILEGIVIIAQRQEYEQRLYTWALFAEAGFEITESIKLEGGIRYNWERKEFDLTVTGLGGGSIGGQVRENVNAQDDKIWDEPTGNLTLTWSPTEFVSVYAKYTHGFKGGHFNGGAFFSAQPIDGVDPETVDSFEIGLKSEWLDGMITLNMAAWYYNYKNYQVFVVQNSGGAFPLSQLLNAPRVESKGVELDAVLRPIEGLELGVSMGILDAEFTDFTVARLKFVANCPTPPFPACPPEQEVLEFSGNTLVASPPVSLNLRASYEIPLGRFGSLTPRLDASFRDKTYFVPGDSSENNLGREGFTKNEGATQDAYWTLNGRIAYRVPSGGMEIAAWVRNLTDEVYLNNSLDASNGLGTYLDVHGAPRTFGVTGTFNW
jgi:iron complex outermembrane receptor protein